MLGIVKEINGEKTIIPLTTDTGTGAPVGTLIQQYKKKPISGYLYCDGSTFDQNVYPALYMYLGTNVLPDYRECVMVGAEQNTTDTIATHDVYTEGEFKDDQMQRVYGSFEVPNRNRGPNVSGAFSVSTSSEKWFAIGTDTTLPSLVSFDSATMTRIGDTDTTHGKQKAVYVYIKATSGLAENQQDNVLKDVKDYVDNSNSYSTDEVKTGGTWIDGKPIYRKVVEVNGIIPDDGFPTGCPSGSLIISMRVLQVWNDTVWSNSYTTNNLMYVGECLPAIILSSDGTLLLSSTSNTGLRKYTKCVILEYTKPTD